MHYVYAALIAVLFPETLSRLVKLLIFRRLWYYSLLKFPGEVLMYWIQHILIFFIVPPFLIYSWGICDLLDVAVATLFLIFRATLFGTIW